MLTQNAKYYRIKLQNTMPLKYFDCCIFFFKVSNNYLIIIIALMMANYFSACDLACEGIHWASVFISKQQKSKNLPSNEHGER